METNSPAPVATSSKTTPKDFFLWLLTVIALYGSITSFIALLFEYINYSFPDALAYAGDPYGGAVRFSMAALIVLVPTLLVCLRLIRGSILHEAGKALIWVRRWALVLTLFIATVSILIDLVTLINTFLGGEITVRFALKVAVVLLVAAGVFLHFLADLKGYWIAHPKKGNLVGIGVAVLTVVTILAGFFIIGTPGDVRKLRYDEQKVNDLRSIQYQLIDYWRVKQTLPDSLDGLKDPLADTTIPVDAQTNAPYTYTKTGATAFTLCATFNKPAADTAGKGAYPTRAPQYSGPGGGNDENWQHGAGETCFERMIDPTRYPRIDAPIKPL
jgi:type II secretory pathway pseudopilin PulG